MNKLIPLCLPVLFALGCSSMPPVNDFPATASPTQETQRLADDLNVARADQVDAVAPDLFEKAQSRLADAQGKRNDQDDARGILRTVAEGRAYLERAIEIKSRSNSELEPLMTARQAAIKAGAATLQKDAMSRADDDLEDLAEPFRDGKASINREKRAELQTRYLEIELNSIKERNLGPLKAQMRAAEKDGAKKIAPRTYLQAEKKLADAEAYINQQRHNTSGIDAVTREATASVGLVNQIVVRSRDAKGMDTEEIALQELNAEKAIQSRDRALTQKDQALGATSDQLNRTQARLGVVAGQKGKLEQEQDFNRLYDDARKKFSAEEAEVMKAGDRLVIRLKNMQFPVNQAAIPSSRFETLSRVQEVIETFGPARVMVEGHTDSTGTQAVNERLSSERARSVADYLGREGALQATAIEAKGFGYSKPIASNKTANERAMNRRVDIIIQPTDAPGMENVGDQPAR